MKCDRGTPARPRQSIAAARSTIPRTHYGGGVQGRKAFTPGGQGLLFTFGGSYKHDVFDMLRDRLDLNALTGAVVPPTNLILPTKYFPKSTRRHRRLRAGRDEPRSPDCWCRGSLRPLLAGRRRERRLFLASQSPTPADFSADAVSSKLGASVRVSNAVTVHAQYAGGFRAPPYSAVNSGFTNLLGGYTSIPNTNLNAETSDNAEVGVRSTVGRLSCRA